MARGGRGPIARDTQVSKKLSWLLRHNAESEGLKLAQGGYINLQEVLQNRHFKSLHVTFQEVCEVVADNEKQRFSMIHVNASQSTDEDPRQPITAADDQDPSHWMIRANQGHSIKVEDDGLIRPITLEADNLPPLVVHGTRREHWAKIIASGGLKPMGRNHVHFATGVPTSLQTDESKSIDEVDPLPDTSSMPETISGMRNTSTVLMYLDLRKALEAGVKFGMSDNGVVLSKGDEDGLIRLELFRRVEEKGGQLLVDNGAIVGSLKRK